MVHSEFEGLRDDSKEKLQYAYQYAIELIAIDAIRKKSWLRRSMMIMQAMSVYTN
jgi:hypothetical protein